MTYWNGDIDWISPAEMSHYKNIYFEHTLKKITKSGLVSSSAKEIPPYSIVMSSRAPIGYLVINKNTITTSQGCKTITRYSNDLINIDFLYFLIKSKIKYFNDNASGTTFKEISGSEFGKTVILLPPINEQERIVKNISLLNNYL